VIESPHNNVEEKRSRGGEYILKERTTGDFERQTESPSSSKGNGLIWARTEIM